jgi:hypothetical protein
MKLNKKSKKTHHNIGCVFMLEKSIKILIEQVEKLNYNLNKNKFIDLIEVMGNKKEMIFRNLFSGLWKGIGIGIGVTLVTAIIIVILQKIIKLNIPIISEYITDIVEIVEKTKSIR